ncbi:MAG: helix-turn-helix domain-containing protein [Mycobacterium sp.]
MERGYDGMTVDDVARLARVGRATLYRRWPTKTAIVNALGRSRLGLDKPERNGLAFINTCSKGCSGLAGVQYPAPCAGFLSQRT